jgi:hypothetical protein
MEVERYSGDSIVLRNTEEFEKLKNAFESQDTYMDKLLFWQNIPLFQQKLAEDSLYTIFTCHEYYSKSHSLAEGEYISIEPTENDIKTSIYWVINLHDPLLEELIETYKTFDNKRVFLEARLKELKSYCESHVFFQEIYRAVVQDKLNEKIDAFRAQAKNERNLSSFALSLRRALRWKAFLAVADPANNHHTVSGNEDIQHNSIRDSGLHWKKGKNSLILLVKLLMETGYLEAPSLNEACSQLGLFLHKDLRNIYDAVHKMYDRNKRGYVNGLIKDLVNCDKKLRESHGQTTEEK